MTRCKYCGLEDHTQHCKECGRAMRDGKCPVCAPDTQPEGVAPAAERVTGTALLDVPDLETAFLKAEPADAYEAPQLSVAEMLKILGEIANGTP